MAFGDVLQTVTWDRWTQGAGAIPFATPAKGNLLVLRVGDAGASSAVPTPTGWSVAASNFVVDVGPGDGGLGVAIFYKISDGTETSVSVTFSNSCGSAVFQELDAAGYGVRLVASNSSGSAVADTSAAAVLSSYNNTRFPGVVVGAGAIMENNVDPDTPAGSNSWGGTPTDVQLRTPGFAPNTNFAGVITGNWQLTADVASGSGTLSWNGANNEIPAGAAFEAYSAPFLVGVSIQAEGTGTTLTPDISTLDVRPGDLVLCQVTNRNNNTPTAPGSQGWNTVYNISRVPGIGTAFNETLFAKIWGDGTSDTSPTFTVASGTLGWGATLSVWRNPKHSSKPWAAYTDAIVHSGTNNTTAAAATATAPSVTITPTKSNLTYVRVFATCDDNALNANSEGSAAYSAGSYDSTLGDDFAQACSWHHHQDGAGSTGTATFNLSINGSDEALTGTLVLAPTVLVTPRPPVVGASRAAQLASRW